MKKRYVKPTIFVTPVAKELLPDGGWMQVSDEELLHIRKNPVQTALLRTLLSSVADPAGTYR